MNPLNFLSSQVNLLEDDKLKTICFEVLQDKVFLESPGGGKQHHAYKHGLLIHTAEVVWVANRLTEGSSIINYDVLTTAAVLHDRNKMFEYGVVGAIAGIETYPYYNLVGHVAGSWEYFMEQTRILNVHPRIVYKISHCMLSHHGRREWGSPKEPVSPEAWALHSADMMSAHGWDGIPKFVIE